MTREPTPPDGDTARPHPWHGLACWRVLDTDWDRGRNFLDTWLAWRQDPQRPSQLHFVALHHHTSGAGCELTEPPPSPELAELHRQLTSHWHGLLPGFHRFLLDQGQVVLTLCLGDTLGLLKQQHFLADTITLRPGPGLDSATLPWLAKALARCCRRGTRLQARAGAAVSTTELRRHLVSGGFEMTGPDASGADATTLQGHYNPAWTLRGSHARATNPALSPGHCAVLGAGLAGASVAAALARRGWQVTVLDQASSAAAGASGLPVGLVVPHVSSDDCVLSQLSRCGVRMMLQQADDWLQAGIDWGPGGVLERHIGGTPNLPRHWPNEGLEWSELAPPAVRDRDWARGIECRRDLWHRPGAWIKPAQLVKAWLSLPGIRFQGNARVAQLHPTKGGWDLLDAHGQALCRAERVVLANAGGVSSLLQRLRDSDPQRFAALAHLPAMQGMRGLLSWSLHAPTVASTFPPHPVNGSGSLVCRVPTAAGPAWFMGSSYQPEHQPERSDGDNHRLNLAHLQQLLPELASQLAPAFESGRLHAWKNTRCISADRLPLVGALEQTEQPGLWICAALGSRGLSFSVLCAELLAAQWGAEPLPVAHKLAKKLEALRA